MGSRQRLEAADGLDRKRSGSRLADQPRFVGEIRCRSDLRYRRIGHGAATMLAFTAWQCRAKLSALACRQATAPLVPRRSEAAFQDMGVLRLKIPDKYRCATNGPEQDGCIGAATLGGGRDCSPGLNGGHPGSRESIPYCRISSYLVELDYAAIASSMAVTVFASAIRRSSKRPSKRGLRTPTLQR
jgi:hypothetical protein